MSSINNLRKRILSCYKDWDDWTQLQRQLLLLRSTHGEYWRKDATDPTADIIITNEYDKLKEVAKIFNVPRGDIGKAIISSKGLMKALEDYSKDNGYRFGISKNGTKMKRRCTSKDLLELICYDNVPASIFSVISGARPRLIPIETEGIEEWSRIFSYVMGSKDKEVEESYQSVFDVFDDRPATVKLSDDGLPNFGTYSGLQQLEQTVKPEDIDKEEDEFFE